MTPPSERGIREQDPKARLREMYRVAVVGRVPDFRDAYLAEFDALLAQVPPTDTPPGGERDRVVLIGGDPVSRASVERAFGTAFSCTMALHGPWCDARCTERPAAPAVPSEAMVEAALGAMCACILDSRLPWDDDDRALMRKALTAALRSGAPQEGVDFTEADYRLVANEAKMLAADIDDDEMAHWWSLADRLLRAARSEAPDGR